MKPVSKKRKLEEVTNIVGYDAEEDKKFIDGILATNPSVNTILDFDFVKNSFSAEKIEMIKRLDEPTARPRAMEMLVLGDRMNYSSEGWKSWAKVKKGEYGLVYIVSKKRFGYYDDDDGATCYVYLGAPMFSEEIAVKRGDLRQPPFTGKFK